jgi:hypothetical protein
VELDVPAEDVSIVLHEPAMENWGIREGSPLTRWISAIGSTSDHLPTYACVASPRVREDLGQVPT